MLFSKSFLILYRQLAKLLTIIINILQNVAFYKGVTISNSARQSKSNVLKNIFYGRTEI